MPDQEYLDRSQNIPTLIIVLIVKYKDKKTYLPNKCFKTLQRALVYIVMYRYRDREVWNIHNTEINTASLKLIVN